MIRGSGDLGGYRWGLPRKRALIDLERRGDDRGFFARFFCEREFAAAGLKSRFVQINNSLTAKSGTLRGMHYQRSPCQEAKVVCCTRGAILDVGLDLRSQSGIVHVAAVGHADAGAEAFAAKEAGDAIGRGQLGDGEPGTMRRAR